MAGSALDRKPAIFACTWSQPAGNRDGRHCNHHERSGCHQHPRGYDPTKNFVAHALSSVLPPNLDYAVPSLGVCCRASR